MNDAFHTPDRTIQKGEVCTQPEGRLPRKRLFSEENEPQYYVIDALDFSEIEDMQQVQYSPPNTTREQTPQPSITPTQVKENV